MDEKSERMRILEMIESGRITAAEGLTLLQALVAEPADEEAPVVTGWEETTPGPARLSEEPDDRSSANLELNTPAIPPAPLAPQPAAPAWEPLEEVPSPIPPAPSPAVEASPSAAGVPGLPAETARWRRWWTIPLWIGVFITVWGGLFMYWAVRAANGISLWFLCASVPFGLGLLVMVLAFQSRSAPWLHLRVQQKPGERPERIALSFPLPVGPVAWFLRTFGNRIPKLKETSLDEVILAAGNAASPENPIYIQVDEGDDGEKVEIYIG